jgi:excinuclease ABC subunit A
MKDLRDLGNTILVVEHDPDVIRAADHLLDLGPGAGELGGHLLASGTVKEVTANPNSITGKYLSGRLTIPSNTAANPAANTSSSPAPHPQSPRRRY